MSSKCVVAGCPNRKGEGVFVGNLCKPCHGYLQSGELPEYSEVYKNILKKMSTRPGPKVFKLAPVGKIARWLNIVGPVVLSIDFDEVPHRETLKLAKRVVKVLNENWQE